MSKMIAIPDDLHTRLEQEAKARGLDIPQLIARLADEVKRTRLATAIERMRAKRMLQTPAEPGEAVAQFEPIHVQGAPLAEVIIEERC